jgi:hypothetical protein
MTDQHEQLLDDMATVAVAISLAGTEDYLAAHEAFLRVLELIPYELRHPND